MVKGRTSWIVMGLVMVVLALGLVACGDTGTSGDESASPQPSSSPAAQTVSATPAMLADPVHVKAGDTLQVVLHGNPSTGYVWSAEDVGDTGVLKQVGEPAVQQPKGDLVGAPARTVITFEAMKQGTQPLAFWYARPNEAGDPGAAYAMVVDVAAGHVPQTVRAHDAYTAEQAQLRAGDTLQVVIRHAADRGRHAWKVVSAPSFLKYRSQKYSPSYHGTVTADLSAVGTGNGVLVLVNRPAGEPPLQTYALPVSAFMPKQPVTVHVNHRDDGERFSLKVGDTLHLSLPANPSTGYSWTVKKPNQRVLKQRGKVAFKPDSSAMGAKGKDMWTFKMVGAGTTTLRAAYEGPQAASTGPAKTFAIDLAVKPGFKAKTVQAVDSFAAPTTSLRQGDSLVIELPGKAAWKPAGSTRVLRYAGSTRQGSGTAVTFKARSVGIATQVLTSSGAGLPVEAYGFSAQVLKGSVPKRHMAIEHRVAKPVTMGNGETLQVKLPGNPTTGYMWTLMGDGAQGVLEQQGEPAFEAESDLMGAPGTVTLTFKAVGTGTVPLMLVDQKGDSGEDLAGMWVTSVTVQ